MKSTLLSIVLLLTAPLVYAQAIFAHNDYEKPNPFQNAFRLKVAYIEADIFVENGQLMVAHTKKEIDRLKTLESLYLQPLSQKAKENSGKLYGITLMIDLKDKEAMPVLAMTLGKYPELTTCEGLWITMSGDYPKPSEWKNYPDYITFDGRPNVNYTGDEQKRLRLISTSFANVSNWDGLSEIPANDAKKIKETIDWAHQLGKPMRFWASPDFPNAWEKFIKAGVDILNSDKIDELSEYLSR